jgi:hypothetical protein
MSLVSFGRLGVVVATAMALAGACSTSRPATLGPPAVPSRLPVSPKISVTPAQLAGADPCGLLDIAALSRLGKLGAVETLMGQSLHSCNVGFDGAGTPLLDVSVDFSTSLDHNYTHVRSYRGIPIYASKTDDESCDRSVVAATDALMTINVDGLLTPSCRGADIAIDAAIVRLERGSLRPARHSSDSLADHDACRLITQDDVDRVPKINRFHRDFTYRGESCTWGNGPIDMPYIYLSFSPEPRPQADGGRLRAVKISGRDAVIQSAPTSENELAFCKVDLAYRPLDRPTYVGGTHEVLSLTIAADQELKSTCSLVKDLTSAVLDRVRGH